MENTKLYHIWSNKPVSYDSYDSFVICAKSSKEARLLASNNNGDEGKDTWLDPEKSTIKVLKPGKSDLIIGSFNAG